MHGPRLDHQQICDKRQDVNFLMKLCPVDIGAKDHAEQIDGIDPRKACDPKLSRYTLSAFIFAGSTVGEDKTGENEEEADTGIACPHYRRKRSPSRKWLHIVKQCHMKRRKEPNRSKSLDIRKPLYTWCLSGTTNVRNLIQIQEIILALKVLDCRVPLRLETDGKVPQHKYIYVKCPNIV